MVLDEMIGAGDQSFLRKARERMRELIDKSAILVLASHNRQLIKQFCTHALWIDSGKVNNIGPVDAVLESYDLN